MLKNFYRQKISSLLRKLPGGSRLNIAMVALLTELKTSEAIYPYSEDNIFYSDSEIEFIFKGLDAESIRLAKLFMQRQIRLPKSGFFIHPKYFYTADEQTEHKNILPIFRKSCKKYGLPVDKVGFESIYYHHGLRFCPDSVKENISGKLFADIGGWYGDSTLVFLDYAPEKVVIFEPVEKCRVKLLNSLNQNSVPSEKYVMHPLALSDKKESYDGMECIALDDISDKFGNQFGVLKADIEGMGLKFIQGAEQTIRRDRPLLSLAIYHNADEFTGIYQLLKSWDLNYHFEIKQFSPLIAGMELSLLAYPEEWSK